MCQFVALVTYIQQNDVVTFYDILPMKSVKALKQANIERET